VTSIGIYLLCLGSVFAVRSISSGPKSPQGSLSQLNTISTLWLERNILLRNIMWPRQTRLEVVNYADGQRFPKDKALPALRVRAWKYVIADRRTPEGWRLLTWNDVTSRPEVFGLAVEAPGDWAPRDGRVGLTADEVELWLNRFPFKKRGEGEGESFVAKWNLPEGTKGEGDEAEVLYRPMRWSDLNAERLGEFAVPHLPPGEWDPAAYPAQAASVIGLLAGQPVAPVVGVPAPALTWAVAGPQTINLTADIVEERIAVRKQALVEPVKKARAARKKLADELRTSLDLPATLAKDEEKKRAVAKALAEWADEPDRRALRRKIESVMRGAQARKGAAREYSSLWTLESVREAEETFKDLRRQTEQLTAVQSVFDRLTRYIELRGAMSAVAQSMREPQHSRLVRELQLPEQLTLLYSGKRTDSSSTMSRSSHNEYTGNFGTLEESVSFRVRGGDYTTPWQDITIVENPKVDRLQSDEERPAYAHYRVEEEDGRPGKASDLRGLRQAFTEVLLAVSGTEASTAEVLAGSSLLLTASTNKPIKSATLNTIFKVSGDKTQALTVWGWRRQMKQVRIKSGTGGAVPGVTASVAPGGHGVLLGVLDAEKSHRFELDYVDTGGNTGSSAMALAPVRDGEKKLVGVDVTYDLEVLPDGKSIGVKIDNVQQELLFTVAFIDEDNVPGSRQIKVTPVRDQAPAIREFGVDEAIRISKEGHIITAKARVPFRARVQDDLGLAKVRYAYTADREDLKRMRRANQLYVRLGAGLVAGQGRGRSGPACRP
jgi:hypothetical protein